MIVCLAQMDSVIGDFAQNAARIVAMTKAALAREGAQATSDLIVFPELSLCGYPPMDLLDQDVLCGRLAQGAAAPSKRTAFRGYGGCGLCRQKP